MNVAATGSSKVGFANSGYWGMDVKVQTYTGSFYVKGSYDGSFTTSLQSNLTGETFGSVDVLSHSIAGDWTQHNFTLVPTKAAPNSNNTFAITFDPAVGGIALLATDCADITGNAGRQRRVPRLQPHQPLPAHVQEPPQRTATGHNGSIRRAQPKVPPSARRQHARGQHANHLVEVERDHRAPERPARHAERLGIPDHLRHGPSRVHGVVRRPRSRTKYVTPNSQNAGF